MTEAEKTEYREQSEAEAIDLYATDVEWANSCWNFWREQRKGTSK